MKFRSIYITQAFIFLLPLFFLPITRDFVDFNKSMLLVSVALVSLIAYAIKSIREKKVTVRFDRLSAAVLGIGVAYVLSLLVATPNKVEALLQPGGVSTIVSLVILFFTVPQLTPIKSSKTVLLPLLAAASFISLFTILSMFGVIENLPVTEALKNPNITPAGTLLTTALFLGIVSVATVKEIVTTKHKTAQSLVLFGAAFLIVLGGTVVNAFRLTQETSRPAFLPTSVSWSIAAENMKVPVQAFLGVGPGNYANAFTIGRTANMNVLDVWNIRFNSASNYMLHIFTETGIVGLVAFLALVYFVARHPKKSLGAITTLIVLAVLPHNVLLLFVLFAFLMVMAASAPEVSYSGSNKRAAHHDSLSHALGMEDTALPNLAFVPVIASVLMIVIAGAGLYFQAIGYQAEVYMTQGILSAATPNNQVTYDLQRKAVETNPYHSEYRIIFSRTNLALANLIAQKPEPTEADVETITQLVVQSVNNGKLAVQLKPSSTSWTNLATIYRNLISAAEGAADWTVQSYNQASAFDRTNPTLRLALGQVYYGLQLYEPAIRQFELAAQLKPDYPNAWYNLANASRELGNIEVARLAYNQVLALIEPGTPDYQTVQAELEALPETIAQDQRTLEKLENPADASADAVNADVELTENEGPELTFPESVAGEATASAGVEEEGTFDLNEPSASPTSTQ